MNSLQVVSFFRLAAGGKPRLFNTFAIVASLTRCPRFFRAPEIRSYPQLLFSRANLSIRASISGDVSVEMKPLILKGVLQVVQKLSSEQLAQDLHRDKEALWAGDPAATIGGKSSAGHDAVDMGMIHQVLSPGM